MRKTIHILLCAAVCLSACQKEASQDVSASRVILRAQTQECVDTRTAYTQTTNPNLTAEVWASTTSGTFAAGSADGTSASSYQVSRHLTVNFSSGSGELPTAANDGIVYPYNEGATPPADKPVVYFVGLYPTASAWTQSGNTKAEHGFHGYEDLMYAPQVSAYYGQLDLPPILHFYHLLTHLRFKFELEGGSEELRQEVSDAWGKLTAISLTAESGLAVTNSVSVTLGAAANLSAVASASAFSAVGDPAGLALYGTSTDTVFPTGSGYVLPTTAATPAYVLCAPVTATTAVGDYEYTVTLSTQRRSNVSVNIDLKGSDDELFAGSTMGQEFIVTLHFTLNSITAAASITDWTNGGYGKFTFDE